MTSKKNMYIKARENFKILLSCLTTNHIEKFGIIR